MGLISHWRASSFTYCIATQKNLKYKSKKNYLAILYSLKDIKEEGALFSHKIVQNRRGAVCER